VPEDEEDDTPAARYKAAESHKEANTRAMLSGTLVTKRVAVSNCLPAPPAEVLRRQFKCPAGTNTSGPSGARTRSSCGVRCPCLTRSSRFRR
jgi:hypothetical protein